MFSRLPDPRAWTVRHRLSDLMFIALAASLCGAQSAVDYAQFGRSKQGFLERVLRPFDPPSHDTFSRLFRRLDPEAFAQAFAAFARGFAAPSSTGAQKHFSSASTTPKHPSEDLSKDARGKTNISPTQ